MNSPITASSLSRRTFSVFAAAWKPILAIMFLAYLPRILLRILGSVKGENHLGGFLISPENLHSLLLVPIAGAALIYSVSRGSRGESPTIAECLTFALGRWFPLFLLLLPDKVILYWGLVLLQLLDESDPLAEKFWALMLAEFAWVLLVFVVAVVLFVVIPVLVLEKLSIFDVFHRSWNLARNHKAPIVGVFLVVVILSGIPVIVLGVVMALGGLSEDAGAVLGLVLDIPLVALRYVAMGIAYVDLRLFKEGPDRSELAEVFD